MSLNLQVHLEYSLLAYSLTISESEILHWSPALDVKGDVYFIRGLTLPKVGLAPTLIYWYLNTEWKVTVLFSIDPLICSLCLLWPGLFFIFSSRNVSKQQHPCIIYLKEMSAVIVEPSQATECNARYCCLQPSVSVFSGIIDGEDLNSHWEGENGGAEGFHLYLRGN